MCIEGLDALQRRWIIRRREKHLKQKRREPGNALATLCGPSLYRFFELLQLDNEYVSTAIRADRAASGAGFRA